ncbi:uncharacterized protein LOC131986163 [Centropristis striata]|uniref:uncharacterized protein LOC131986163 n=1 Tax=Centropristis striata TaxID=184440 RepID=UPI0027DFCB18|nr:uncharacterized protein LOC131986163 [Centropristis striata]XP_059206971.1 uncharacterized protein LOC131986163 [Centropristis striata]XP_059206972.1 uncharacterized protein LOC131986163 [Centropristis striata]
MSDISEKDWRKTLTTIIENLGKDQYKKMLAHLDKISECKKTPSREKMPGVIIQNYGVRESIKEVDEIMDLIPRRDDKIQDLLRPFVDKLNNEQDKENQGKKRKREEDEEESEPAADPQKSSQADKGPSAGVLQDRKASSWKKSISDLKSSGILNTEGFIGKVVQKSGLHKYQTKEKEKKVFFYVAVADETASVRLMVYGKDRYQNIKEGNSYSFRKVIQDEEFGVKLTKQSVVARTRSVDILEELEMEARKLIYPESPVYKIDEAKTSEDKTVMSVEGTVTEITPVEKNIKVHYKQEKTKKQNVQLEDETGSIRICMWGEDTELSKGLSLGDIIKVTNVKSHVYFDDVSLNSTRFTKIHQVKSVGIQNIKIEITGIIKATKKETHLDVETDRHDQLHTFVVATPLLAKAFSLKGDVEESLLEKMPLFADAVIEGGKITKIEAIKKM